MDAGGSTIAVVGSPLDVAYPKENRWLQTLIMRDHLCISQFSPGSGIRPSNFPIRNRTMALLSDATVIVEAGPSSGTTSQAWEALRLGRDLFLAECLWQSTSITWVAELRHYGAQLLSVDSIEAFIDCASD